MSEWKETSDLSKLAWPLMEIARLLEGKEGPGDVQVSYSDRVCLCLLLQTVACFGYEYSYLFAPSN